MTEFSMLPWQTQTGIGDGPLTGYNQDQANEFFRDFSVANLGTAGPLSGIDNELEVTGTVSPLSVDTGKAHAYGRYWNLTNPVLLPVTTPTAPAAPTAGRVVIRTDWAANSARLLVNQAADGNLTPPALVQVAGTTWDIPLAIYEIDGFGGIKVTDDRHFNISPSAGTVRLRHFTGVAGATSSITFVSLQQDLTHLRMIGSLEDNAGLIFAPPYPDLHINFNNDFGGKYTYIKSTFAPAGVVTAVNTVDTKINMGSLINLATSSYGRAYFELEIHDYANVNGQTGITFKSTFMYNDNGANQAWVQCMGRFGPTATSGIDQITLTADLSGAPYAAMRWDNAVLDIYGWR